MHNTPQRHATQARAAIYDFPMLLTNTMISADRKILQKRTLYIIRGTQSWNVSDEWDKERHYLGSYYINNINRQEMNNAAICFRLDMDKRKTQLN